MPGAAAGVRVAAVADIHARKTALGAYQDLFSRITQSADVLLLCGDLTDYGSPEEARVLAKDITSALRIPAIGVLGNHDFETGKQEEIVRILTDAGVVMLDGDVHEVHGIGFAGVKGFCGGFGRRALGAWGEKILKDFVHETVEEALKLEAALARLRTPQKIALLHYSPIHATVGGEPPELQVFLGSSRLEEPIDRHHVSAVFHGHAHRGSLEGRTKGGAAVYNVALPVMLAAYPDKPPFRVIEVAVSEHVIA